MAEPSIADVLMNNDLRLRRSDELFHTPQQTQEIKPLRMGDSSRTSFFDYINNPTRTEDPLKNLLAGVIGTDERMGLGDFIPGLSQALAERRGDKLGEALSYLDYIPGGGIAPDMVTAMSAALSKYQKKRADIIKRLKREQKIQETADATEMAGSVKEVNRLKKQLKKLDAAEAKRAAKFRIEDDYVPPPKGYTYKAPPEGALFRGDKSGMKNFDITDASDIVPSSGIYSLIDPTDPRFKMFAKGMPSKGGPGSGYVITPNFENILDIDNIPPDLLKKLKDIQKNLSTSPSAVGPGRDLFDMGIGDLMKSNKLGFELDTILRGGPGSINKTPSGLSQDIANIFTKEGYDALRFPPRAMKGESDTIISLNPKNLEITDEIPYDQLDDFIRQLLSGK
tara:strand:- start:622 stop:1806 length:1185 start_codon:yes stop_codon:yes gene_type:complete